ncbi:efflux RND transporter periplasmic adaptor subunit [Kamptonema sp. UHCC 0994]|uniref:efflux RND transporter periplasmic adaptor subunit n=1 Tax=Kamptonema sp. UHCC 0994 TaxID=3031329 RepID=UPI0023B92C5F|nr:efflux RND transporter periplasmic adaptor subunit [Kamptonema sp. UHCC 0994]MDF0555790.1 efflux RND transporter periplasmic adaptor subunit [Kamptonema sp. UHCC 0994]
MKYKEKNSFKTGVKWLLWSSFLTLSIGGGLFAYGLYQNRPPEPVEVRLLPVKIGNIEDTINESGTIEFGSQQTLKSPLDVTVDEVLVQIGQSVTSGQSLIALRNPAKETILGKQELAIQKEKLTLENLRQKLLEAQTKLSMAKETLQYYRSVRNDELLAIQKQELTLANNRKKVIEAEENLAAAERKLVDQKALLDKGYIAENEVRSQQDQIRLAKANLRDAQFQINTDLLELKSLKIKRRDKEQQLEEKVIAAESEVRQAQLEVSTNSRNLQTSLLDYREKEEELKNNIVTAPIDGKVLDIKVKNGDGVARGTELLTLGDPSQELVKLQLSTLNAAKVRPNQSVRISIIGPNSKQFSGRVESLFILAGSGENNSSNNRSNQGGQATVPATVRLDTPSGTLIPGSQVNVEIILQQRQKVVVLDTEVIVRSESQPFVWIRDSQGQAQKRPIKLGLEGLTQVEITSGLRPGDTVAIPPPEPSLKPGTPIQEEKTTKKDKKEEKTEGEDEE